MKIYSYLAKQWRLRLRDVVIATLQAAFTAAGTFFLDQFQLLGANFNFKQTLGASVLVFCYHIGRKLLESNKLITMQEVEKKDLPKVEEVVEQANEDGVIPVMASTGGDDPVPPPIADPTNPKPPKGEIG